MSKVKGICECPHKCHAIVDISALTVSTQASCHYPRKLHVIIHTSMSISKQASRHYPNKRRHYPNNRHDIIQTSDTSLCKQTSRHYPNKTSVTSLSKQAPEPLYWHTPPNWYSRYDNVHPYKLFTVRTRVNRCSTTADSFTRLLPSQCWVENRIALPHTLFHLATVNDRNRLA